MGHIGGGSGGRGMDGSAGARHGAPATLLTLARGSCRLIDAPTYAVLYPMGHPESGQLDRQPRCGSWCHSSQPFLVGPAPSGGRRRRHLSVAGLVQYETKQSARVIRRAL